MAEGVRGRNTPLGAHKGKSAHMYKRACTAEFFFTLKLRKQKSDTKCPNFPSVEVEVPTRGKGPLGEDSVTWER